MVTEFNGFSQGVIGKKLPADTTLNNMKKAELIELLHIAQHNYDVLNSFYTNAVNVNMEKIKAMDIFNRDRILKRLDNMQDMSGYDLLTIQECMRVVNSGGADENLNN